MVSGIDLIIQSDFPIFGTKVGDYFYDKERFTISFELPYFFPCKFKVIRLRKIVATPMMLRLPHFLKYHDINNLRQQLHQIKCITNRAVLLHGSAWEEKGVGTLAVGFPNSGKTTLVIDKVRDGAKYCADENVIVKDGIAFPVARQTSLAPWNADKLPNGFLTNKQRVLFVLAKLRAKVFPIFEPNIWVDLPYPQYAIKVNKIKFLTEGLNQRLRILTDNEFPWFTNPLIQTYAYATGMNLDILYEEYKGIIDDVERLDSFS